MREWSALPITPTRICATVPSLQPTAARLGRRFQLMTKTILLVTIVRGNLVHLKLKTGDTVLTVKKYGGGTSELNDIFTMVSDRIDSGYKFVDE